MEHWYVSAMDWMCSQPRPPNSPTNSYVETLTSNVTIFGEEASKEVYKVKWSHKSGALIQ